MLQLHRILRGGFSAENHRFPLDVSEYLPVPTLVIMPYLVSLRLAALHQAYSFDRPFFFLSDARCLSLTGACLSR